MTGEMLKTAAAVDASLSYLKKEVNAKDLEGCDLLFVHIPSVKYTPGEVGAITKIEGVGDLPRDAQRVTNGQPGPCDR
jgi:hypothetical protein